MNKQISGLSAPDHPGVERSAPPEKDPRVKAMEVAAGFGLRTERDGRVVEVS
jgi:hypothetical protein